MSIDNTFAQDVIRIAELYEFTYKDGTKKYFTTYDYGVVFQSNFYEPFPVTRTSSTIDSKLDVGEITVTLPKVTDVNPDGIIEGDLENGAIVVYQVDVEDVANWRRVFTGNVATVTVDGATVQASCKDELNMLLKNIPRRSYSESCPFSLGDDDCKIVLAAFTDTGTAATGSTTTVIIDEVLVRSNDYYRGGYLEITSGADAGTKIPVSSYSYDPDVNKGYITVLIPFSNTTEGQTFSVIPHCEKSKAKCDVIFNNLDNFGAFEFIPRPEEVYTG